MHAGSARGICSLRCRRPIDSAIAPLTHRTPVVGGNHIAELVKIQFTHALFVVALSAVVSSACAQSSPYAGEQQRSIKALSESDIAELQSGHGRGLPKSGELNGYPGPIHAIELADKLGLSPDQLAELKKLFEAMKAEAIPLGMQLIAEERTLDDAFAGRTITPASLDSETQKIGAMQARLRAAHLRYHLSTVAVLTPEQIEKYKELRGYSGGAPQHQHMHR